MSKMTLHWTEELATGYAMLDNQHKKIVIQINRLFKHFKRRNLSNETRLEIDELERIIEVHDNTELRLMEQYHYPDMAKHLEQHHIYKSNIATLKNILFKAGHSDALDTKIFDQAVEWQVSHINQFDKQLGEFLGRVNGA